MSTDELQINTTLSQKGSPIPPEEGNPVIPLNQAVADLARAYVEEMRDDVSERQEDDAGDDAEDAHRRFAEDTDAEAKGTEKTTRTHATDDATAREAAKEEFSKLSIPFPESIQELESNIQTEESASFPSEGVSAAPSKASSASASVFGLDDPLASMTIHPVVADDIISRFESILVSETNDTESISELGSIMEARGVISTLLNYSQEGCCISPSSLRGERACVSRFAEIEEMSCEDEELEELVPYYGKESERESSLEDLGGVVVGDEEEEEEEESVVEATSEDLMAKSTQTVSAENAGVADKGQALVGALDKVKTDSADEARAGISSGSGSVETEPLEPAVQVEGAAVVTFAETESLETKEEAGDLVVFQDAVEEDHKEDDSAVFHDAIEEDEVVTKNIGSLEDTIKTEASDESGSSVVVKGAFTDKESIEAVKVVSLINSQGDSGSEGSVVTEEEAAATIKTEPVMLKLGEVGSDKKEEKRDVMKPQDRSTESVTSEEKVVACVTSQVSKTETVDVEKEAEPTEPTIVEDKEVASTGSQDNNNTETIEANKDEPVIPSQDVISATVKSQNIVDTAASASSMTEDMEKVTMAPENTIETEAPEKAEQDIASVDIAGEKAVGSVSAEEQNVVEQKVMTIETSSHSSPGSVWKLAAERAQAEHYGSTQNYGSPRLQNASSLTEVTSNIFPTSLATDKKVHWSVSLDALSSDGGFPPPNNSVSLASSVGSSPCSTPPMEESASSASSMDSYRRSTPPAVPKATKTSAMMESYNRVVAKDSCSGPFGDATRRFFAKISDWKLVESSTFSSLQSDLLAWTEAGACSKDTTMSPVHQTAVDHVDRPSKEEVRDVDDVQERDSTLDKRKNTSGADADSGPNGAVSKSAKKPSYMTLDMKTGYYTETTEQCKSSPIANATKQFFSQVGSELKVKGPVLSGLASEMNNYCGQNTACREEKTDVDASSTVKILPRNQSPNNTGDKFVHKEVPLETADGSKEKGNMNALSADIPVSSESESAEKYEGSATIESNDAVIIFNTSKEEFTCDTAKLTVPIVVSPRHLHEAVYREREYLREWKLDAEETMQCQDAVTGILREQKLTLVKQVGELEGAVKDLKEWKYNAQEKMTVQAAGLEDLGSQKTALLKQCDKLQESIKELTQWKSDAEEAIAAQDEALQLLKARNSTLAEECGEQWEAIEALTTWKNESTHALANKSAELESVLHSNADLTRQCKNYQETIQELSAWKVDAGLSMENNVVELKQLREENSALCTQCSNQEKSLEELKEWKCKAEETMSSHLRELEPLKEQNSDLTKKCTDYKESVEEMTKWKSTAEETIKKQIKTIEELTRWKIEAEELMRTQTSKLESLQDKNSELVKQLNGSGLTIQELTASKIDADKERQSLVAEIDSLKAKMGVALNEEERASLEELTEWKSETEKTMKNKEAELNELRAHYLIFGKQCNIQKELIEEKDLEIMKLSEQLKQASEAVTGHQNCASAQSNKLKTYEEVIQSKSNEISGLKAKVFKLTELNEQLTQSRDKPYKDEMIAMKMAHHKELMVLKTERHQLASKIEALVHKNEVMTARIMSLNQDMNDLENQLREETEKHCESKVVTKKLEKALKAAEKRRKQLEQKIASEKDFCDILSQRLNEGL